MSCELTTGYTKPNCANVGGLKQVVLIQNDGVVFTVAAGMATIASQTKAAHVVELDINSGFANSNSENERENNSAFFTQEVMFMLKSSDLPADTLADILSKGYFKVIATDRNGRNKVYGVENGLFSSGNEGVSGQASGDMNGWTINLSGEEANMPPHMSNTELNDLLTYTPV